MLCAYTKGAGPLWLRNQTIHLSSVAGQQESRLFVKWSSLFCPLCKQDTFTLELNQAQTAGCSHTQSPSK